MIGCLLVKNLIIQEVIQKIINMLDTYMDLVDDGVGIHKMRKMVFNNCKQVYSLGLINNLFLINY